MTIGLWKASCPDVASQARPGTLDSAAAKAAYVNPKSHRRIFRHPGQSPQLQGVLQAASGGYRNLYSDFMEV